MKQYGQLQIVGRSTAMIDLRAEITQVANADVKVLISGESGTGKELVARAIHDESPRARRPWVALNCAGMPETLLESEMFGHVKGSFTGAYRDRPGKIEIARGGTLFLDEIGEMSLRMQGMLLRFLETGELQKVGSDRRSEIVDVRVVAATNRDLRKMVVEKLFREDLFYRLNVIHLIVPPLRERRTDIPELIDHFLRYLAPRHGSRSRQVSPEALKLLTAYPWPGNVRELENIVERIVVTCPNEVIEAKDLPPDIRVQAAERTASKNIERRRTVADDLYDQLVLSGESFWSSVYPLYIQREITRGHLRDLVRKGLEESRGNYKIVTKIFNMESSDYKRFVNFLRKHDCRLPFKPYRQAGSTRVANP